MKKTIATKKIRRWQRIDRLALAVPPILFILLSMGEEGRLLWGTVLDERKMAVTAAALLLLALSAAIMSLPILLLWRAVSNTVKKAAIRNATFRVDEDFDYYREKLTGLPPTTISLLMDLQIEVKKDVAASLLKYVMMGVVSLEGGTVRVLDQEHPGLLPSDRTLLAQIAQGQASPANLGEWKRQAIAEAVKSGNLKQRGAGQNVQSVSAPCLSGCLSGCLLPILLLVGMGIGAVLVEQSGWLEKLERFTEAAPQAFGMEQVGYFLSSPDMVLTAALACLILLPLLIVFWLPIAALLRTVLSVSNTVGWMKRTEAGEVLSAQISGMKNFIRDFSNLSEAEKGQLVLWDDFLIYAVVLEENERIIEDIFRMKDLRYRDFTLF